MNGGIFTIHAQISTFTEIHWYNYGKQGLLTVFKLLSSECITLVYFELRHIEYLILQIAI